MAKITRKQIIISPEESKLINYADEIIIDEWQAAGDLSESVQKMINYMVQHPEVRIFGSEGFKQCKCHKWAFQCPFLLRLEEIKWNGIYRIIPGTEILF